MYDPLDAMTSLRTRRLECPQCSIAIDARQYNPIFLYSTPMRSDTHSTAFVTADGRGYLQRNFSIECTSCSLMITKETLSVMKFARDLVLDPLDLNDVERHGPRVYLA